MASYRLDPGTPRPRLIRLLGERGNILALARDPLATIQRLHKDYGPVAALADGPAPVFVALGPDAMRDVLAASALQHPSFVSPFTGGYGVGIPFFPFDERYFELLHANMVDVADQLVQRWAIGYELDAPYTMTTLVFRAVCRTLFGTLPHAAQNHLEQSWRRWVSACSPAAQLGDQQRSHSLAARRLRQRTDQLISAMRQVCTGQREGLRAEASEGLFPRDKRAAAVDDADIEEMLWLMVMGHTSGTAIAWTLFLLSQHPLILADLHSQIWSRLHGANPLPEDLERFPLLNEAVAESLRLLPPISIGQCVTPEPLALGEHTVPPNATILYSPFVTHRAPHIYLWPHAFRPERWRVVEPEVHQYLPFGAHPMLVAGMPLASRLIKLILIMVVQHVALGLAPGASIDLHMNLTLTSRSGLPMVLAPRDRVVIRRLPTGNIFEAVRLV